MSIWKHHNKNQCITFKKSPPGMPFQLIPYLPDISVAWELKNTKGDSHLPIHHLLQNVAIHFLCVCVILETCFFSCVFFFLKFGFHYFTPIQNNHFRWLWLLLHLQLIWNYFTLYFYNWDFCFHIFGFPHATTLGTHLQPHYIVLPGDQSQYWSTASLWNVYPFTSKIMISFLLLFFLNII